MSSYAYILQRLKEAEQKQFAEDEFEITYWLVDDIDKPYIKQRWIM